MFALHFPAISLLFVQMGPAARSLTASTSMPTNFKDALERRAEENNILFVPVPNKTYEAKQVYRFGRVQIYLDRGVVFHFANGIWSPISLNTLVDIAR